jgi:hypothetical protein
MVILTNYLENAMISLTTMGKKTSQAKRQFVILSANSPTVHG